MKLRPVQLVCLALLLAALRLADPTALAPGDYALQAGYLDALLSNAHANPRTASAPQPCPAAKSLRRRPSSAAATDVLSPASRCTLNFPWTMPHPASHSAALQSFTGLGRRTA